MHQPAITRLFRISLLAQASPGLLVRFLRPFEDYLEQRGIDLDGGYGPEWVVRLYDVLTRVDPAMPGALQQALVDVSELASAEGQALAREVVGERQLVLFAAHDELGDEDLAFTLYLEHRDVFAESHDRMRAQGARRFVSFFSKVYRPMSGHLSEPRRILLSSTLRRWFGERNRSEYIEVKVLEANGEVTFLVIHGLPPRSRRVITSVFSRDRISFVPDREDAIVFDQATGKLSVCAQYPAEQDLYRRLVGRIYFGDDDHFEPSSELTAEPLLEDPVEALSADGIAGLEGVVLRELVLEAMAPPYDSVDWWATELNSLLLRDLPQMLRRRRQITHFKLALRIRGLRQPKVVEILPPSTMIFDPRTGRETVLEYLFARGFMRLPEGFTRDQAAA